MLLFEGELYLVGSLESQGESLKWLVEKRSTADGSIIWTRLGGRGVGPRGRARGVAADESGLYVAGAELHDTYEDQWRIEKRSLVDGSLIWERNYKLSDDDEVPESVTVVGNDLFVGGYHSRLIAGKEDAQSRVEKRRADTGDLVYVWLDDPDEPERQPYAIAAIPDGLFVASKDNTPDTEDSPGDTQWRIERMPR